MVNQALDLKIPHHIAVIMDGNGRWAKERGLERTEGHKAGEEALMRWVRHAQKLGVKEISFYTFSTENWSRTPSEVKFLMTLSKQIMRNRVNEFIDLGARVKWVGRKTRLWKSVLKELEIIQSKTAKCSDITVNFCINYGGRSEILDAVNSALADAQSGGPTNLSVKGFEKHLYSPQMSDVDLLIRTSGEVRTSNFLPWQLVYAEMVFIKDYWPDVDATTLESCLREYTSRDRRFGGVRSDLS